MQGHVNGVQQGCPALCLRESQAVLDVFQVGSEVLDEFRPVIKLNQKEFVFRIGRLKELAYSLAGFAELVPHAPAGVKYQADGERRILAGEVGHLLFDFVLKETEILFLQPGHKAIQRISHSHVDKDNGGVHADVAAGSPGSRDGRFGAWIDRNLRVIRTPTRYYDQYEEKKQPEVDAGCHRTFPFVVSSIPEIGL